MKPVHRQLLALLLAVVLGSALCLSLYVWDNKYTRPGAQPMDGLLTLTDEELEQTDLRFLIHGWAVDPGVLLTPAGRGDAPWMRDLRADPGFAGDPRPIRPGAAGDLLRLSALSQRKSGIAGGGTGLGALPVLVRRTLPDTVVSDHTHVDSLPVLISSK